MVTSEDKWLLICINSSLQETSLFSVLPTYVEIILIIVGSTDQESFQKLQFGFLNIFPRQNVLCSLSLILFLLQRYRYGAKKCLKYNVRLDFEMIRL